MKLSHEQKILIQGLKDKNLLVSAAAGSGKTMVLVKRILHLVTVFQIPIHQLLIVTFTQKAASEMKERIRGSLEEILKEKGGRDPFLQSQLQLLNKASISTLHSFCLQIVRERFYLLHLDPSFRIGESSELHLLSKETFDEILAVYSLEKRENFYRLVEAFGNKEGDRRFREIVLAIYRYMQSHPKPFQWLEKSLLLYNVKEDEFPQHIWVETMREALYFQLKRGLSYLHEALALCQEPEGPHGYQETIMEDQEDQRDLMALLKEDLGLFLKEIKTRGFPRLKALRGSKKEEVNMELLERVKELRNSYKEERTRMASFFGPRGLSGAFQDIQEIYLLMECLSQVIKEFHYLYQEKKFSSGILDYHDLEHLALEVLAEEEVRLWYQRKYRYLFIDEYQDSNPVQEKILQYIKGEKNLFMVGDIRQSIYRFRLADPSIFFEKYNTFQPLEKAPQSLDIRVDLKENFRSRSEVIHGVNFLFKHIMSPDLGEMDYDEGASLKKGLDWDFVGDASIHFILVHDHDGEEMEEELQELTKTEIEAYLIVERIKKLLQEEIFLPKEGVLRKICYRDIVILLRSPLGRADIYDEVFHQEGIPLYVDQGEGFYRSLEVQVMLNLLRVIDNHRQDLPLLSLLHSPIGGFHPQELAAIRMASPKGSYYQALQKYGFQKNPLGEKVSSFLKRLAIYGEKARYLKVADLLWYLLFSTNYYDYCGILPGGEKRQFNLKMFVEKAEDLENASVNHLFDFIHYIDSLDLEGQVEKASFVGENEDVVRLMSVHKSKGLEFPVVILGDLGRRFNLKDITGNLLLHKDLGIGLEYLNREKGIRNSSLAQLAIKEKKKRELLSEELRILYVAMTRAIDRLVLLGTVKNMESTIKSWLFQIETDQLQNANSYLDWIGPVLIGHKDGYPLRQVAGIAKEEVLEESSWKVTLTSSRDVKINKTKQEGGKREYLEEQMVISQDIKESLEWSYPYEEAVNLPSKLSVTDILALREKSEGIFYPSFNLKKKEEALRKGIVMHQVMNHLPLTQRSLDIPLELERMVHRGLLQKEDLPLVHIQGIEDFLRSHLGERMQKASKVFREVPFLLKKKAAQVLDTEGKEEILIQGIIDVFFLEEGGAVLIDYKTDMVTKEDLERIRKRYRYQVNLYQEAIQVSGVEVKESYLYLFSYGALLIE